MDLRAVARLVGTVLAAGTLASLAACAASPAEIESEETSNTPTGWVVVVFEDRPSELDTVLVDALLETELAADQALADANAGWIDGNDVGDSTYELYFVGDDPATMWEVLEPVFSEAPVPWSRVELRDGLEDPAPTVLEQTD